MPAAASREAAGPNPTLSCVNTIAAAIAAANADGTTTVSAGCDINSNSASKIAAAVAVAKAADITVLVLDNDRSQEHGGIDRPAIGLAGVQPELAKHASLGDRAMDRPTLPVLSNDGTIAIDALMGSSGPKAISSRAITRTRTRPSAPRPPRDRAQAALPRDRAQAALRRTFERCEPLGANCR